MTHLIIVAHGSRRKQSNHEIFQLSEKIRSQSHSYAKVDTAFLEFTEPSIKEVVHRSIKDGAKKIIIVPCFLAAGKHVTDDIPSEIETLRKEHPTVTIRITPHIGASESLPQLLIGLASQGDNV